MGNPFPLHLITLPLAGGFERVESVVVAALDAGVRVVQLRDKQVTAREMVAQARVLRGHCRGWGAKLVVNDRLDVALAAGADGVHLGEDDLPWVDARRLMAPPFWIGVSVDREEMLERAIDAGADYCGVGPAYRTTTKPDAGEPQPAQLYRTLVRARGERSISIIAVGGVALGGAAPLIAAGADGVAVGAAIFGAADPGAVTRAFLAELAAAR